MTPYIQQQLKKLCDNPNWYDDMLISWDKNPRNQREAIYNYLSHVQLNGLLENTQIVFTFIDGYMKPAFYFEIPRDTNRYLILGILDDIPKVPQSRDKQQPPPLRTHKITNKRNIPNPGSNKNDYTLYLSDPQAQYNKLLRTQQKLKNKKK